MQRDEFLADPYVSGYLMWMSELVSGEREITHSWHSDRLGDYRFTSVFDAFSCYYWSFSVEGVQMGGFDHTERYLDLLRSCIREYALAEEWRRFRDVCVSILKWGNTPPSRLPSMADTLRQASLLSPRTADTLRLGEVTHMSASYSKIYTLLVDDLPIYDSRVACALTSSIHIYAEEASCAQVPEILRLGVPESQVRRVDRNPYNFPVLRSGQTRRYADSCLKSAWLLGALTTSGGDFTHVPAESRLLAVQSAMFMLGYAPLGRGTFEGEGLR